MTGTQTQAMVVPLTVTRRRQASIATDLLILMVAIVLTMISPLVTEIANEFSLDKVNTGFLFTANFIGFAAFILIGGVVSDRIGKRPVLITAAFVLAACLFLMSFAPVYIIISMVIILIGGACGVIESIASAQLAELNPGREGFHINVSQIFFCLGALIGPFGAALLINLGWTWRQVYQLTGGIALAVALGFLLVRFKLQRPSGSGSRTFALSDLRLLLRNKVLLLLCLCMFLYTGSEIGAWTWMVTFMMEKLQFTIVESSLAVGAFWFAMIVGRMLCTVFLRWFTSRQIVIVLGFASAAATAFSALASTRSLAWLATILIGLTYSSIWPLIIAYGSERMKSSSGTMFSMMVGSGGLGSSIIPAMIGVFGQHISIEFSMLSPAIFFVMVSVIFIYISRMRIPA